MIRKRRKSPHDHRQPGRLVVVVGERYRLTVIATIATELENA